MKNILDEPRDITIGGRMETFHNYGHLAERGDIFIDTIRQAEAELDEDSVDAANEWKRIADLAGLLAEVIAAQEQWLADHDAILAAEIDRARREIRNLNPSSGIEGSEPPS